MHVQTRRRLNHHQMAFNRKIKPPTELNTTSWRLMQEATKKSVVSLAAIPGRESRQKLGGETVLPPLHQVAKLGKHKCLKAQRSPKPPSCFTGRVWETVHPHSCCLHNCWRTPYLTRSLLSGQEPRMLLRNAKGAGFLCPLLTRGREYFWAKLPVPAPGRLLSPVCYTLPSLTDPSSSPALFP